jgi:predicted transporter
MMKNKIKYFIVGTIILPAFALAQKKLENPLKSEAGDTIPAFITYLIDTIIFPIGMTIVVLFIIYAGFLFVTAAGNSDKLETAKRAILYAVIGAAILLGAKVIAYAIEHTIDSLKSASHIEIYEKLS